MNAEERAEIEKNVIIVLCSVYDPEIPVNIYELGLIYEISISDEAHVKIRMTLTSPNCPVAESLPNEVQEKVALVKGVTSAEIELTFEPTWDPSMLSEEARLELGFL
jgi:FeS assembly SUF system protein